MKVTLFDYTGNGSENPSRLAAEILLFTKSTRLNMEPSLLEEIMTMSEEKMYLELKMMADTLPSSWEFIHFSFLIQGVTRAFTHQLVRTRTASYAQQAMRIVKMEDFQYSTGSTIQGPAKTLYDATMKTISSNYEKLINDGVNTEDARGILPTNIHTNICMSINMRNFINMVRKRSSLRVQDEYRSVLNAMVMEVEKVFPWFYIFMKNDKIKAMTDLQNLINETKTLTSEEKMTFLKKIDLFRDEL